jgi:cyclohexadienyl dehydratase
VGPLTGRNARGARLRYAPGVAPVLSRFLAVAFALVAAGAASAAAPVPRLEAVRAAGVLRVCIWPDYYGITWRNPKTGQLDGFDIDMARAFARDLGVKPAFVDSSFPSFARDLDADRCDVAMFAIGKLPARLALADFTRPVLESDIYGVATRSSRVVRRWEDIDRPGVNVAVQAGTFMEPVMREKLKLATLVVVAPPRTREEELEAGRVDVFMTDYPYSRRLLDNADWARLVAPPAPFFRLPYAYAVRKGEAAWLARVDEFVAKARADGRLAETAKRHRLEAVLAAP